MAVSREIIKLRHSQYRYDYHYMTHSTLLHNIITYHITSHPILTLSTSMPFLLLATMSYRNVLTPLHPHDLSVFYHTSLQLRCKQTRSPSLPHESSRRLVRITKNQLLDEMDICVSNHVKTIGCIAKYR
jgi:hypothetical protein